MNMNLLPTLLCVGGALVLSALSVVPPPPPPPPSGVPTGWSVSDAIGKTYAVGYDAQQHATYLESIGKPPRIMTVVNETIVQADARARHQEALFQRANRVPYSTFGMMPYTEMAAALTQSFKNGPYANRHVTVEAEVRNDDFAGRFQLHLRSVHGDTDGDGSSAALNIEAHPGQWQHVEVDFENATSRISNRAGSPAVVKYVDSTLEAGFTIQGKGRVWIRHIALRAGATLPPPEMKEPPSNLQPLNTIFQAPKPHAAPTNLELHP
ncbi:MAG: hypothetical protein V4582_01915 [Pseudomonadota bacterium]